MAGTNMVYLDACIDFHNCVFQDKSRDFDWWLHRKFVASCGRLLA